MFSKQRSSKKEFVGMIRNIFGSKNPKPSEKLKPNLNQEDSKDKGFFRKTMKSRLPFIRVNSLKFGKKRSQDTSPERSGKVLKYTNSASPKLKFEEPFYLNKSNETISVAKILKTPSASTTSFRKSLRFEEDIILEDFESFTECGNNVTSQNMSFNAFDPITSDTTVIQMGESDEEFYIRMKQNILKKNSNTVSEGKPKRKRKTKTKIDEHNQCQLLPIFIEDHTQDASKMNNTKIDEEDSCKNRISTYLRSIAPPSELSSIAEGNMYQSCVEFEAEERMSQTFIDEWQAEDQKNCKNIMAYPENSNVISDTVLIPTVDPRYDGSSALNTNVWNLPMCSIFQGKAISAMNMKQNRFDPISRRETCAVSLLKDSRTDSSNMSWCSLTGF